MCLQGQETAGRHKALILALSLLEQACRSPIGSDILFLTKFPGDTDIAYLGTTLWEPVLKENLSTWKYKEE